jgi:hypothetical protein
MRETELFIIPFPNDAERYGFCKAKSIFPVGNGFFEATPHGLFSRKRKQIPAKILQSKIHIPGG